MIKHFFKRLLADHSGGTAIEYGLILALVVIAMVTALTNFAGESTRTWNNISTKTHDAVQQATGG